MRDLAPSIPYALNEGWLFGLVCDRGSPVFPAFFFIFHSA
jgi:hypothetical protein